MNKQLNNCKIPEVVTGKKGAEKLALRIEKCEVLRCFSSRPFPLQ